MAQVPVRTAKQSIVSTQSARLSQGAWPSRPFSAAELAWAAHVLLAGKTSPQCIDEVILAAHAGPDEPICAYRQSAASLATVRPGRAAHCASAWQALDCAANPSRRSRRLVLPVASSHESCPVLLDLNGRLLQTGMLHVISARVSNLTVSPHTSNRHRPVRSNRSVSAVHGPDAEISTGFNITASRWMPRRRRSPASGAARIKVCWRIGSALRP